MLMRHALRDRQRRTRRTVVRWEPQPDARQQEHALGSRGWCEWTSAALTSRHVPVTRLNIKIVIMITRMGKTRVAAAGTSFVRPPSNMAKSKLPVLYSRTYDSSLEEVKFIDSTCCMHRLLRSPALSALPICHALVAVERHCCS